MGIGLGTFAKLARGGLGPDYHKHGATKFHQSYELRQGKCAVFEIQLCIINRNGP